MEAKAGGSTTRGEKKSEKIKRGQNRAKRKNRSVKTRAISRKPRPKIEAHKGKMRYPPPTRWVKNKGVAPKSSEGRIYASPKKGSHAKAKILKIGG